MPFEQTKPALDNWRKMHMLTSIGALDRGHGAGDTQVRRPVIGRGLLANKSAFFDILAAEIITVKKGAFNTCRGAHVSPFKNQPADDWFSDP